MSLQTVALIGAGPAGRAFALRCAASGFDVVLEDVMPSNLRRAQDDYAVLAPTSGTLRYALTVEDAVHSADIAIDFVPDELESKLEIFSLLDRMAPPRTILCTPTRTLSITDLASCTYRPSLCFALRDEPPSEHPDATLRSALQSVCPGSGFSDPGSRVQIIRSRFADPAAITAVETFLTRLGIHSHLVADLEQPMLVKNLPR